MITSELLKRGHLSWCKGYFHFLKYQTHSFANTSYFEECLYPRKKVGHFWNLRPPEAKCSLKNICDVIEPLDAAIENNISMSAAQVGGRWVSHFFRYRPHSFPHNPHLGGRFLERKWDFLKLEAARGQMLPTKRAQDIFLSYRIHFCHLQVVSINEGRQICLEMSIF